MENPNPYKDLNHNLEQHTHTPPNTTTSNKRRWLIPVLVSLGVILLSGTAYIAYKKLDSHVRNQGKHHKTPAIEAVSDEIRMAPPATEAAEATEAGTVDDNDLHLIARSDRITAKSYDHFVFIGDKGYIKKGKLLNTQYQKEYDALPDNLSTLNYGDYLYCMDCEDLEEGEKEGFSYARRQIVEQETNAASHHQTKSSNQSHSSHWRDYLKLALAGHAEFPTAYAELIDNPYVNIDEFNLSYKPLFEHELMQKLPYGVKVKLAKFFESKEDNSYLFEVDNNLEAHQLLVKGNFSGGGNEYAVLLKNTIDKDGDIYALIVLLKNKKSKDPNAYYIGFQEDIHKATVLQTLLAKNEGNKPNEIYMDSDAPKPLTQDAIKISHPKSKDFVLVYDTQFGKMVKYEQMPLNEIKKRDSANPKAP